MPGIKRSDHLIPSAYEPAYFHRGNRPSEYDSEDSLSSTNTGSEGDDDMPASAQMKSSKAGTARAGTDSPPGSSSGLGGKLLAVPKGPWVARKRKGTTPAR